MERHAPLAPKLFFIINERASGFGTGMLEQIKRSFQSNNYEISLTQKAGDAASYLEELFRQGKISKFEQVREPVVVACGGDGLVSEVLTSLQKVRPATPVLIVPIGTANLLADETGSNHSLTEAVAKLKKHLAGERLSTRELDLGLINGRLFVLRVNFGLFAETTTTNSAYLKRKWGRLSYIITFCQRLFNSRSFRLKVSMKTASGRRKVRRIRCLSMSIMNAGSIGIGGMSLNEKIKSNDGFLDVIVFRRLWLIDLINWVLSIISRQRTPLIASKHYQCKSLEVTIKGPVKVVVDDEEFTGTNFDVSILSQTTRVLG